MNFYQQFREMAKYTHDTLCKSERNLFYKDYYEKHQNDFSQIQEKDITFPNDKKMEAELKEIIEKIFTHEFWNKTEYTKQMISEYSKIINNKTTLQVRERIFETNNPGIAMFTFQFGETTKQFLPVNIFNYVCNLNDSIQRKYDSCFFIKEIFSSGKNRISNLFDDTNIEDKHIFNIFRKNIYHDFYNENIEKQEKIFNKEKSKSSAGITQIKDDFILSFNISSEDDFVKTSTRFSRESSSIDSFFFIFIITHSYKN